MKHFYIPVLIVLITSVMNSARVHADIWYTDSTDFPGGQQQFVIDWCKSKNWFEKWWCDCCSDEDIAEVKKLQEQEIAKWEEEYNKCQQQLNKLFKNKPTPKPSRFDEDIEERLEVLEQKVRELESR